MGLNFPNSPTVGQLFPSPPTAGVPIWKWDGTEWVPVGAGGAGPGAIVLEVSMANNQTGLALGGYRQAKYDTKVTDAQNAYSTSTGFFTPTVAGLYMVVATLATQQGNAAGIGTAIAKNGSVTNAESQGTAISAGAGGPQPVSASALIYCNGTTDTISVWGYQAASGTGIFYSSANAGNAINMVATLLSGPIGVPSAGPQIKASGRFQINAGGSITIISSYNIASVVRTGVGTYTVTFTTALADANYAILATAQGDASSNNCWIQTTTPLPSTTVFYLAALQNAGATGDPRQVHFMCVE